MGDAGVNTTGVHTQAGWGATADTTVVPGPEQPTPEAWSEEDAPAPVVLVSSWRRVWFLAVVFVVVGGLVAAGVWAGFNARESGRVEAVVDAAPPEAKPQPEVHPAPPAPPPRVVPQVPVLTDGTYRVTHHWPQADVRAVDAHYWQPLTGQPAKVAVAAFRTDCTSECVLTITPSEGGLASSELRWRDGAWRKLYPEETLPCYWGDGTQGGYEAVSTGVHLYPDLRGSLTHVVVRSDCGNKMRTMTVPVSAERVQ